MRIPRGGELPPDPPARAEHQQLDRRLMPRLPGDFNWVALVGRCVRETVPNDRITDVNIAWRFFEQAGSEDGPVLVAQVVEYVCLGAHIRCTPTIACTWRIEDLGHIQLGGSLRVMNLLRDVLRSAIDAHHHQRMFHADPNRHADPAGR